MRTMLLIPALILALTVSLQAFAFPGSDTRSKNANYVHKTLKQEEKEKYERKKLNIKPSGFMTAEEYELLSAPKDKTVQEAGIPRVDKPSDMKYVPQPVYKIVRYNNPPGTAEISLKNVFHQRHQQNAQGIVSPDFTMLVYPAVYYYPESASTACDLFVIPLKEGDSNLAKIMKANTMHRLPEPIMSTDKSNDNQYTFRTLTPVDFSLDSSKLIVKEKIGSSKDGIWKTNLYVYDFVNKTSYNLVELRDSVIYYWKEYKGVNLEEKRWDIYPLGFDLNDPSRVISLAYAYTGERPVFLGSWSIDCKGEQTRLISWTNNYVDVSMNGFKLAQDGVVPPNQLKTEEKNLKRYEKMDEKEKREAEKAVEKSLKDEYKQTINQMNEEYKLRRQEYNIRSRIKGSTQTTEIEEQYKIELDKLNAKREAAAEKARQREAKRLEKQKIRDEKRKSKEELRREKLIEKYNREHTPPEGNYNFNIEEVRD